MAREPVTSGPILVTGAAGFVASHLVPALRATGADVVGIRRPTDRHRDLDVRWIELDLSIGAAVAELVADVKPAAIVHLAGLAVPREAARQPLEALRGNYGIVHHLLTAMRKSAPSTRLLLVSSGEVYGRRPRGAPRATETDPLLPENVYAATRVAAERLAALRAAEGLDVICARPFNHTGPGRPADYAEASFALQIARAEQGRGEPRIQVGNLEAVRDFSDVRDVVSAYQVLLERGESGATYNVCSGIGRSIGAVLERLCAHARVAVEVAVQPSLYEPTPADRVELVGDPSRLRALGWTPRHDLDATLDALLDYCRSLP